MTAAETSAYEEAVRRAFLAADSILPASPVRRRVEPSAPTEAGTVTQGGRAPAQAAEPAAPDAPLPQPAEPLPQPAEPQPQPARAGAPKAPLNRVALPPDGPAAESARAPHASPISRGPEPAADTRPMGAPAWWPVRPLAQPAARSEGAKANAASAAPEPAEPPTAGAPPAISPLPRGTRSPGPATTDELMQVPGSVTTTVDDFFGGVVRRVERHS